MDNKKKDNLTDLASQISNQPKPQQPQNSNSGNNQPQNLTDNQVIGNDGTVIDLNNNSKNTVKK